MPDSSSERTEFIAHQNRKISFAAANEKAGRSCPGKRRVERSQGARSSDPSPLGRLYCFANISFIMSLSTSVVSDALYGMAGLHCPLTTGCILKGTLIVGGTSLPSFFIIAAVKAKRAWSFWPFE